MTAERDFRENTRAMRDLSKSMDGLTKAVLAFIQLGAVEQSRQFSEESQKESFRGMTAEEAGNNIKNNSALIGVCSVCFVGRCLPGIIYNDKCSCCNKSHRKN